LVGCCGWAPAALGERGVEPFRILYQAEPECPTESAFVDLVLARTSLARLAQGEGKGRTFVVALRAEGKEVVGTFTVQDESGGTDTRALRAANCAQAARALSLVVAITIDPNAKEPARAAFPATSPPAPASEPPRPALGPPPPTMLMPTQPPLRSGEQPRAMGHSFNLDTGLRLEIHSGPAPKAMLVPSAFWAFSFAQDWVSTGLTVGYGMRSKPVPEVSAEADFSYLGGRLDACVNPVRGRLRFGPCVGWAMGMLRATGIYRDSPRPADPYEVRRLWLGPSLSLRAAWRPWDWAELGAVGGLGFPLVRNRFFFRDRVHEVDVHWVPWVSSFVGLEAGIEMS
jgi:hypothetical protein